MAKIWKATWHWADFGQDGYMGVHYQWDGNTGSDEPDAANVASHIDSHASDLLKNCVRDTGTLIELLVLEETDPGSSDVPEQAVVNINEAGTVFSGTAGSMASEEVALLHRKTGAAVRGAKSWCFTPAPRGGATITAGLWDTGSALWTKWNALADGLEDDIDIGASVPGVFGTLHPVAYSRTRRNREQTPFTFNVTSVTVDARPRWLRSRGD